MKRYLFLIITMCAVSCSSAWAEVTLHNTWVVGGAGETPSGSIDGSVAAKTTDGSLVGGNYVDSGKIDTSPLSSSISYDLDGDGIEESYAGSKVGLFYAEAYAEVIEPGTFYSEWSNAEAIAGACFSIDSSQLSLHWLYEISPYDFGFVNYYGFSIIDWETQDYVCYYSNVVGSPFEATETVDLIPNRWYVLNWELEVGAGRGFDNNGWASLSIDLEDVGTQPIPVPSALILGGIGVGFVNWLRRRRTI
jgi:hypothetical protein